METFLGGILVLGVAILNTKNDFLKGNVLLQAQTPKIFPPMGGGGFSASQNSSTKFSNLVQKKGGFFFNVFFFCSLTYGIWYF